jgi:hypothetical protein
MVARDRSLTCHAGAFVRTIHVVAMIVWGTIFLCGTSANAQAAPDVMDSASVAAIKPDRLVRFAVPDLGRVKGRVSGLSGSSVILLTDDQSRSIPIPAIDTLWVRARATKAGGIVGALLGLGGGVFLGAVADALCETDCAGNATVSVGVVGTIAGAGIGALIGSAIPRWKKIFPH